MFLSDRQITNLCETDSPLLSPFVPQLIRNADADNSSYPVISYGCSSHGYDLRLSPEDVKIFRHVPGTVIDPKNFNKDNLVQASIYLDGNAQYLILPAHSYALGVTPEKFTMPRNLIGIVLGKSTYARTGVIVNATPIEAGWEGHLTLELSNSSPADVRIYLGEGIAQVLFADCQPCRTSYGDRGGKYQGQAHQIVPARA